MKIMIAEDEEISRVMLQTCLENWGYDVKVACDGQEALDIMQAPDAPQIAILDWMMPKMEGPVLCHELRRQEREDPLYLILLTSRDKGKDIILGLQAGADDLIAKPYDSGELQARINVGKRILRLHGQLGEQEKLQGVLEMSAAVCHELNQPLQAVMGFSELLLKGIETSDPNYENLKQITKGTERLWELTQKIMKISRYQSKTYVDGSRIIDIDGATQYGEKEAL
jgi:DNA-binding response OmpR family regulator